MPTAGYKTGTVQRPTGESSEAPSWMREANRNVVPRSKEPQRDTGWKTNFRDEFEGAHGEPSGAVLDDAAQSTDAPDWIKGQTGLSPRAGSIPLHKQTGRGSNDLGVQGYKAIDKKMFVGAHGAPSGAALDDAAQSSDAPEWMRVQTKLSPRGQVPLHKQTGRSSNDLGVQGYKAIDEKMFVGAAGNRSGAVLDDSAESGDAPQWMRNMGKNEGVPRSQYNTGGGWKTTFDQELFNGAAGRPTGVLLSDDAQSNDAPDWMKKQTGLALRKKEITTNSGWKTDFTKEFEGRMGKPSGAVLDDSAQSGDAPDWMQEQSYLSPRGTVPRHKKPGQNSNDLGIQSYRSVDPNVAFAGAAGRHTGVLPDDSAVSGDLPEFMMIPEIPVHPGNVRHGKQATWKTEMENNHGDTTVSASAPAFFHIEGVGQYGDKYEEQSGGGGVAVGSQPKNFENAAGVTTGGVTDDSSVSAEMPVWMNNNKHVHVRNSTQRSMGLGHIAGKPVPRISNKDNNSGGYHQIVKKQRFQEQGQQGQQRQQQRQQNQQHEIEQLRQQLERAKQSYAKNPTQQPQLT